MTVEIIPVRGVPAVRAGDDLGELLADRMAPLEPRRGDVVAVTQKVVSKAEGRLVPEGALGRAGWVERESVRVLARRGDLVISQTRHGFVCANAGVDASNVEAGLLTLLPEDPDASAGRLRSAFADRLGLEVAVVVTDTFGRPWRRGLVNVAIGCAGLPALVDLRGTTDHTGRELEATVVALADEVAAASGLVMGKAARIPAAIVRGVGTGGPVVPARELVRPPQEDLFPASPLLALTAPEPSSGPWEVPDEVVQEAARAAMEAAAPGEEAPRLVVAATSAPARRRLLAALDDGGGALGSAAVLLVPFVRPAAPEDRDAALAAGGAAVQNLILAFRVQGYPVRWMPPTRPDAMRSSLEVDDGWVPLGVVAAGGETPAGAASTRPPPDLSVVFRTR
ncbi:MAG TPA: coenzyme F420-0:L-glutamate ligase [Actinomycetota bacterium]|nr:coenzyme F420-0:L-glutamate ligase [Actinomycetota bacterium]